MEAVNALRHCKDYHCRNKADGPPLLTRSAPMPKQKNLRELFHDTLKDIYFAEKKIVTALPKMAKAAQSEDLKAAFQKHESETEEHVERLNKVFAELDEPPRGKTCDAIVGIIEEGQECQCRLLSRFKPASERCQMAFPRPGRIPAVKLFAARRCSCGYRAVVRRDIA